MFSVGSSPLYSNYCFVTRLLLEECSGICRLGKSDLGFLKHRVLSTLLLQQIVVRFLVSGVKCNIYMSACNPEGGKNETT